MIAKENMVEHIHKTKKRKHNGVGYSKRPISDCDNKKMFKGTCFVCNKTWHQAKNYRHYKRKNAQANMIENVDGEVIDLIDVVLEVNFVDNPKQWWVDYWRHLPCMLWQK
jgi:hypothetical protein